MKVEGVCPIQGYAVVHGWLCYFRARDGWSFRAWAPGWNDQTDAVARERVLAAMKSCKPNDFYMGSDIGSGIPEPRDPSRWSNDYAGKVADWCCEQLRKHIAAIVSGFDERAGPAPARSVARVARLELLRVTERAALYEAEWRESDRDLVEAHSRERGIVGVASDLFSLLAGRPGIEQVRAQWTVWLEGERDADELLAVRKALDLAKDLEPGR
jgi:hypothetical protein